MRTTNAKLAADLLEAGKREFLEKGFQGASLRSIAASLGVTTGAIYGYYTDKEAMFDALVSEPAQKLADRYRELQKTFAVVRWRSRSMICRKYQRWRPSGCWSMSTTISMPLS